jgi:hypothetical protein
MVKKHELVSAPLEIKYAEPSGFKMPGLTKFCWQD